MIDKDLRDRLFTIITNNDIEGLKQLIAKGVDLNQRDEFGRTPLYCAAGKGHIEIVNLLLDSGVDPNDKDKYYNRASVYEAAANFQVEVVNILLAKCTNHTDTYFNGDKSWDSYQLLSALDERGSDKDLQMVKILLDKHIILKNQDSIVATLHQAMGGDNTVIVQHLLESGFRPPDNCPAGISSDIQEMVNVAKKVDIVYLSSQHTPQLDIIPQSQTGLFVNNLIYYLDKDDFVPTNLKSIQHCLKENQSILNKISNFIEDQQNMFETLQMTLLSEINGISTAPLDRIIWNNTFEFPSYNKDSMFTKTLQFYIQLYSHEQRFIELMNKLLNNNPLGDQERKELVNISDSLVKNTPYLKNLPEDELLTYMVSNPLIAVQVKELFNVVTFPSKTLKTKIEKVIGMYNEISEFLDGPYSVTGHFEEREYAQQYSEYYEQQYLAKCYTNQLPSDTVPIIADLSINQDVSI